MTCVLRLSISTFLLYLVALLPKRAAFTLNSNINRITALHDSKNSDDAGEQPPFDADMARQRLQSLLGDMDSSVKKSDISLLELIKLNDYMSELPPPPPLSTIERDRRTAEIHLIRMLENGDEALAGLWNLWYSERGSIAKSMLRETDELLGDPNSWHDCEIKLLQLVRDYGIYFVEPVNRLATLYYLKGKFHESYKLCRIVLKIKPWHFGALSGIVQVCIRMGDMDAARLWAAKGLPNINAETPLLFSSERQPVNPRRIEWVENAISLAQEMQKKAERLTQERLGEPEEYYKNSGNENANNNDAWQ